MWARSPAGKKLGGRRFGPGFELANERAKFVGSVRHESAVRIATQGGVERANGLSDIGGEGVHANLQLDDIGGGPRRGCGRPRPIAQGVNGGANAVGVGGDQGEFFAIDLNGFAVDARDNLPVHAGRDAGDFGEPEVGVAELGVLTNEAVGMRAADTGILFAEFVPGEAEVVENLRIADLLEALSAGG